MSSAARRGGQRWRSLGSRLPFGVGATKPRHYAEMARVVWENRDALPYAWRILSQGTCDGCALGTKGLKDWTLGGTHLCMVRLELMRLNTMPAFAPERLASVGPLETCSSAELRALGRLPTPFVRRQGEPGFRPIAWEAALDLVAERLRAIDPLRAALYLTSRGIPNETYYVAQKAWRFFGSPHVDNSARLCHAASTTAMRAAFGHGAATCSYRDWLDADLIVFFGSNVANNQPVALKYVHEARRRGAEIAMVNPYREPGMERYWIPSDPRSALLGSDLVTRHVEVETGGDLALLEGVCKALLDLPGGVDREAVEHAEGFQAFEASLRARDWPTLEAASGASRERMEELARLLVARPKAVLVWSMGLTQHAHGVETVRALCNLGLMRGLLGRRDRGLVPIRGHSGVQGGAEVGAVPVQHPATLDRWKSVWGFDPPRAPGMATVAQIDAAAAGDLDLFWILGGNFLETLGGEDRSRRALAHPGLRVHQDIVLNSSMLVEPSDTVLLLPTTTRYEMAGGVTETSTERRIIFSPEVRGPRIRDARAEWQVFCDLAARVDPERGPAVGFPDTAAIRREISLAVPLYAGIETLAERGDSVQWGGPVLYTDGRFATDSGRAAFGVVELPTRERPDGTFRVSTRRGKQFNSMVQRAHDNLNGAARDDVLMSSVDARSLGVAEGDAVRLVSAAGRFDARVRLAPIKPGNLEVYWPEGNVLLSPDALDRRSGEPDYNALVTVEIASASGGAPASSPVAGPATT
ncbi:MAG: FdhF/YdeP family oxidoreductase [Acidobacteriota bacterium]